MEVGHNADLAGVVEAQADEIQDLKEMDEQVSEQGEHEIQALKEMDEEVSELDEQVSELESDLCALRVEMDVHNIPATPKVLDRMQALESQLQMLSVSLSPAASPSPAATPVKLAFELSEVATPLTTLGLEMDAIRLDACIKSCFLWWRDYAVHKEEGATEPCGMSALGNITTVRETAPQVAKVGKVEHVARSTASVEAKA